MPTSAISVPESTTRFNGNQTALLSDDKGVEKMKGIQATEELKDVFQHPLGTVQALYDFTYVPDEKVSRLAETALEEQWGIDNWVLKRYLSVYIRLAIEQERYVKLEDRIVMTAGHLQTRYGTPVYLSFSPNREPSPPWYLQYVGDRPNAPEYPQPALLPDWPTLTKGAEIVIVHQHILDERAHRVDFLADTPRVAQMCAIAGAIQWSLFRELELRQLYLGVPSFFVPLYLKNREDITVAPDLVVPVQVRQGQLLVRTALEPYMAYANLRIVASRHDKLPHWLISTWHETGANEDPKRIEDEERLELSPPKDQD